MKQLPILGAVLAMTACTALPVEIDLGIGGQNHSTRISPDPMGVFRVRFEVYRHEFRFCDLRGFLEYEHLSSLQNDQDRWILNNGNGGVTCRFN